MVRAGTELAGVSPVDRSIGPSTAPRSVELLLCTGVAEFRPGDDLAAAIAEAAPWLRDGDVVVVTSKVVSKCRGPHRRRAHRPRGAGRPAPQADRRRGRARGCRARARTLITENAHRAGAGRRRRGRLQRRLGLSWRCCRPTPTPAPRRCGPGCANASASRSASSSPTPWAGPGATARPTSRSARPALAVLHGYAGGSDRHGNELLVTEVAVADELAAAADLVKGKLTGIPVAVVRGLHPGRRRLRRPHTWCAPARRTCSGSAPPRRIALGRTPGAAAAPLGAAVRGRAGRLAALHRGRRSPRR